MKKIKFIIFSRYRLEGVNGNIYKANSKRLGWWGNMRRQAREGQALIPMVLFILMGIMLLGVILEAGNLFIARRHLQNDADAAATWGAMQLDIGGLRVSNGDKVHIISPGDNQAIADRAGSKIIEFMTMAGYRLGE